MKYSVNQWFFWLPRGKALDMPDSLRRSAIAPVMRAVLNLLLGVETILGILALIPLVVGFAGSADDAFGQRISILLAGALGVVWIAITFWGALRSQARWPRSSAVTIHVLLFAAGTGMLRYVLAPFSVSVAVVAVGIIGFFVALLARSDSMPGDADAEASDAE